VGTAAGVAPEAEERIMIETANMWVLYLEPEYHPIAEAVCNAIDGAEVDGDCPSVADGWWPCTRDAGHPGRHMAQGLSAVCAAWPGTHAPTLADLGDTQVVPQ
jgi:hypothetical protein